MCHRVGRATEAANRNSIRRRWRPCKRPDASLVEYLHYLWPRSHTSAYLLGLGARFALSRTNNPIYVLTLPCIHTSVPDMMTMLCVYYFDRQHLERDSNAVCMYVPSTGSRLTNVHPSVVQYVWSYQRLIPGDRSHAVSSCLDATHNVWFAVCYLIGLVV